MGQVQCVNIISEYNNFEPTCFIFILTSIILFFLFY